MSGKERIAPPVGCLGWAFRSILILVLGLGVFSVAYGLATGDEASRTFGGFLGLVVLALVAVRAITRVIAREIIRYVHGGQGSGEDAASRSAKVVVLGMTAVGFVLMWSGRRDPNSALAVVGLLLFLLGMFLGRRL